MLDNMRRLHPRGAANRGVCVDSEGAMLGPECVLVHRTPIGFRAIEREDASLIQKCVLGGDSDRDWLFRQCQRIAGTLDRGELALAQIYGLHIPISELDDRQLKRIALAWIAKAFNPDEPRIPKGDPRGGEWTTGADGGGESEPGLATPSATTAVGRNGGDETGEIVTSPAEAPGATTPDDAAIAGETADPDVGHEGSDNPPIAWEIKPQDVSASDHSPLINTSDFTQPDQSGQFIPVGVGLVGSEAEWLATLTPTAASALREVLLGMEGASVALGFLFIPTNRSAIVEGPIDNSPGVSYRFDSDMGILQLRQDTGSLGPLVVSEAHIGIDGLFRDAEGHIIGRYLAGSGLIIDAGALPGYRMLPGTATAPDAGARNDNQPKLCPDPSAENTASRSDRSLAYQEQITGLPRGLEVKLNDVRFDGCVEADGTMLEAKGPGFADKMLSPSQWPEWYRAVREIQQQMRRQSDAAPERVIEWHFAERTVADFFRKFAKDNEFPNIVVIYTPPRRQ